MRGDYIVCVTQFLEASRAVLEPVTSRAKLPKFLEATILEPWPKLLEPLTSEAKVLIFLEAMS